MMRRIFLTCILTLNLAVLLRGADDRLLQWMDRIAQQQLSNREAALAKIHTVDEAKARQAWVRAKILELLGGLPDYQGPLNPRVTGRIDRPSYVIEKVDLRKLAPILRHGQLVPAQGEGGKHPGVLMPMGHWEQGKLAAQPHCREPGHEGIRGARLRPGGARRAPAGLRQQGRNIPDRQAQPISTFQAGAQSILAGENFARYRIWDAKRALDYLVSRPEVDSDKIGCTGCSGGGTLTTYISALDPRIKVAAPACYINSWRQLFAGPTGDSEQSFPFFLSSGLDVADYIELFAPKPWLINSTVGDFFPIEGARHAYQEALDWYRILQRRGPYPLGDRSRAARHAAGNSRGDLPVDDPLAERRPRQLPRRAGGVGAGFRSAGDCKPAKWKAARCTK